VLGGGKKVNCLFRTAAKSAKGGGRPPIRKKVSLPRRTREVLCMMLWEECGLQEKGFATESEKQGGKRTRECRILWTTLGAWPLFTWGVGGKGEQIAWRNVEGG